MKLFLLMIIVTSIEVVLIAKIGAALGFFPTLAIIIGTALLGSKLLKEQWRFVMSKLQSLQGSPSQALLEALIVVVCGVLLITPGFLTDIVGFLGLVPAFRTVLVQLLAQRSSRFFTGRGGFQTFSFQRGSAAQQDQAHQAEQGRVFEGEYEHKDSQ